MAGMSGGSVLLGDLNDFINPSQACVNPIFVGGSSSSSSNSSAKPASSIGSDEPGGPRLGIKLEHDLSSDLNVDMEAVATPVQFQSRPDLIKVSENETAKVSLSDCLACSGCVTSAETVLIEQQSTVEFEKAAQDKSKYDKVIVTVSGQSRASLAAHFGLSSLQLHSKLSQALAGRGVDYCLDLSLATDVALVEVAAEFLNRYRSRAQMVQSGEFKFKWESPKTSIAVSSNESQVNPSDPDASETVLHDHVGLSAYLPMLASVCPGWICFTEKSHPEAIPYISTSKSPQQVAGSLVKRSFSASTGTPAERIYHATIMPCADKKLEASRKDFYDSVTDSNDVDCVLTTTEVAELLNQGIETTTAAAPATPSDPAWSKLVHSLESMSFDTSGARPFGPSTSDGGSGGYVDYVFRVAAKELFGVTVPPGPLPFKEGRNADIKEVELHVEGKPVLKFATAYGFRNIQSIIRQMKRGKCAYDFVEIMACPGGCLNGGGQARPVTKVVDNDAGAVLQANLSSAAASRERLQEVDKVYHDRTLRDPSDNPCLGDLYDQWIGGAPYSDNARRLLHTRYHAVPKLEGTLLEKW